MGQGRWPSVDLCAVSDIFGVWCILIAPGFLLSLISLEPRLNLLSATLSNENSHMYFFSLNNVLVPKHNLILCVLQKIFEKYNQIHMSQPQTQKECSIFPAVQKMLQNLPDPPYLGAHSAAAAARHPDPATNQAQMGAQKMNG